jgi:RsiW-degrading membrane proteinase PrsW (M82 family)
VPPWVALVGVVPPLLYMLLVDRLDAKRPEPRATLRKTTLAGALAFFPCVLIEEALERIAPIDPLAHVLFRAFVGVAVFEELAKLLCIRFYVWNKPEFDERLDGIVYGARAALGFALVENVVYLVRQTSVRFFVGTLIVRALLSVPAHGLWTSLVGHMAARRRFDGRGPGFAGGYAIAVLGHGIFDAALLGAPVLKDLQNTAAATALLAVPVLETIAGFVILRQLGKRALADDDVASIAARALR